MDFSLTLDSFKFPDVESQGRQTSVDSVFTSEIKKSWPGSKFNGNFALA